MEQDVEEFVRKLQEQIYQQARELYSETVIDHWRNPRNQGAMENPDGHARIKGPCGDTMEIFLRVDDDIITEPRFLTDGCMTTLVSASMAVELASGQTTSLASGISQEDILEGLGGLPPESRHCALLAANTMWAAIQDYIQTRDEPWKRLYRRF